MKGLARFGNRWPSGARSSRPQPGVPGSGAKTFAALEMRAAAPVGSVKMALEDMPMSTWPWHPIKRGGGLRRMGLCGWKRLDHRVIEKKGRVE